MTEAAQSLIQQIQQQTVKSAQDFYGSSLGSLKGRLENDRSQLEDLLEQLPESQQDARAHIEQLIASYETIGDSLDEVAQQQGVEEAVNQVADQAQETVGQATGQVQEAAGQATEQVQDTAGQATQEAQDVAGDTAGQAQEVPGPNVLSETTNELGQTVRRTVDESGDIVETVLDESGELVDEDIVGNVSELSSEEEYTNEEGQTVRTVKEETGALINLKLGPDGNILDLSLPPQKEEVVEEEVLEEEHSESYSRRVEEELDATDAARQKAEQLGVDLSQVEGSGAGGRITVKDVREATQG